MNSKVYFIDFKANPKENTLDKLARLIKLGGINNILTNKDIAGIKLHFGEKGNTAFIRPPYIRKIIKSIKQTGATPFLTDANTLYAGTRSNTPAHIRTAMENGFSYSSMDNTPIIIADGIRGQNEIKVNVNQKNCKNVYIGSEIIACDALISIAHFKGHELSGFGGTLKNLGMGCASRKGKLEQHSTLSPKIKAKNCEACLDCAKHCPGDAIIIKDKKAFILSEKCIGCGECIIRCPAGAINIRWNQAIPIFLEKMMEYTLGVLKNKKEKVFFVNFITDISPGCDCLSYNDSPIIRDIGILASLDPVAIDQASADLVNAEEALPKTCLKTNRKAGEDKFKGLYPYVDWEIQLEYAQKIGLGNRKYDLETIEAL